jgi:hypothetical protein
MMRYKILVRPSPAQYSNIWPRPTGCIRLVGPSIVAVYSSGVKPRHLNEQEWTQVRLEYESSPGRPTLRELVDKHGVSRSTIFKRAARKNWKRNSAVVNAARRQVLAKVEARLEAETPRSRSDCRQAGHGRVATVDSTAEKPSTKASVRMAKRGFQRIENYGTTTRNPKRGRRALLRGRLTNMTRLSGAILE